MPSLAGGNNTCANCGLEVSSFCGAEDKDFEDYTWLCGFCRATKFNDNSFCHECSLEPECHA